MAMELMSEPSQSSDLDLSETPVVAVPTHRNLSGLRRLIPGLREQALANSIDLVVVDNASEDGTREWLTSIRDQVTSFRLPLNEGPAAAFNRVFELRPRAEAYLFFGDDTLPGGGEVEGLLRSLRSDPHMGIVAGLATTPHGRVLATTFRRRPFEAVFPRIWAGWWGVNRQKEGHLEYVDVLSGSGMAIRGDLARKIGPFEKILWPAAFEDLDYCARARFSGWRVAIDREVPIRQEVSATTTKVFGSEYGALRRAAGLMYVTLNYPLVFATGRFLEASINAVFSFNSIARLGDGLGLLRCARAWKQLLHGRKIRRELRQSRRQASS